MQEIITPSQVAALLQVHVKTVYRLAEQGIIPGHKIGRRWRFRRKSILDLVAGGQGAPTDRYRDGGRENVTS